MSGLRPACHRRSGIALAEMLVALALCAALAAGAALALTGAERYVRRTQWQRDDQRALRDAELILRTDLRAAAADSLRVLADTAVEFMAVVGSSVVCATSSRVVVLPPDSVAAGDAFSVWRVAPEVGDALVAWDTTAGGAWRLAVLDSVGWRADGAGCVPSTGFLTAADSVARTPVFRVHTDRALAAGVVPGSPVRVERRARYVLVRGADGLWALSYRRCAVAGGCGASQPVVGPFASPADSGFVVGVSPGRETLEILLRAPAHTGLTSRAAVELRLSLRNRGGTVP